MAIELEGLPLADHAARVIAFTIRDMKANRPPMLHIYRDTTRPNPFAFGLVRKAGEIGVEVDTFDISECSELVLSNENPTVDGIIVADDCGDVGPILPRKDIDHYRDGSPYRPAVSMAVMSLLCYYGFKVEGCCAVVIGRSRRVGLPIAKDLIRGGATVTVCHTSTPDLERFTGQADLVVGCTGSDGVITPSMVRPGSWVVDTGCDVDRGRDFSKVGAITPRIGGVGPLTIVSVLHNLVHAWRGNVTGGQ